MKVRMKPRKIVLIKLNANIEVKRVKFETYLSAFGKLGNGQGIR